MSLEFLSILFSHKFYNTFYLLFIFILIAFVSFLLRNFFAKFLITILSKVIFKFFIKKKFQLNFLLTPFKIIPFIISVSIFYSISKENLNTFLFSKFIESLIIIFFFWVVYKCYDPLLNFLKSKTNKSSFELYSWLYKLLKFLIIIILIITVLETWGVKVFPFIAGLGLFGVAIALAAQDLFKNLISGVLITLEKPFDINDVINVPGIIEGTVEKLGFRSTLVRKFDTTSVLIPNFIFSVNPIINYSNRKFRRIVMTIGLNYNTSISKIKNLNEKITQYISSNEIFISNDDYSPKVNFEKFSESTLDITIYCYTRSTEWSKYLSAKEDLSLFIKKIAEDDGLNFAFPSRTIFIEK